MRRGVGVSRVLAALLLAGAASAQDTPKGSAPPPPKLPPGVSATLWKLSVPPGAEPTPEKVTLGQKLFLDKRLSLDDSTSCSTCHDPEKGFVDGKPLAEGVQKQKGKRNSPTVLNAMFNATQFWDGRVATLEEQAKLPILNPVEMAMPSPEAVVAKVRGIPEYASEFQKVFGREVTYDDLASAISAFERTQFSGNAPFDKFLLQGDEKALDASAKRGWALFNGKARCNECHAANATAPLFSDQKFHNIGIAAHKQDFVKLAREGVRVVRTGDQKQIDELALQTDFSELGRFLVTKSENDVGGFKTSTLRNIGITAPYMHDGSLATLWDVMDHYNKGGVANPFLDGGMQRLGLTEAEIDDMVAFLFTLTDERYAKFNAQELARQRARKNVRPERDTALATGKKGNMGDIGVSPDFAVKNPAEIGVYGGETAAGKAAEKAKTPAK
ncbi:cytochrome-c peroxidase [Vitiosangium sp. GDMCC 1.1324]|uniref:cytochrome-c peroxidase n=1 Tax=Vitiosangium sp. (strain GDMCC 1.1324) TaxID=2138576 RepID=UPI000D37C79A|nr:cytochrome c peroxidase [Vitiosangium sp. GDMCC 1.1324]PTL76897.1 cytochrome-c peroxidase [Vitiosangium sp. GDMCC 1.1324]